jgi:hypothetical protein
MAASAAYPVGRSPMRESWRIDVGQMGIPFTGYRIAGTSTEGKSGISL